jgi:IclR family transcriptional regulator, acetate operon repressor
MRDRDAGGSPYHSVVQKESESSQPDRRPAYPITSVDNALRLLGLFREHEKVRLSDARDFLGVAHSTAHRLLAMLNYHDFVRQEQNSRVYVAGPALVEIGLAAVRSMDIRTHAQQVLLDLVERFGETAHLVGLEGGSVRYLDAVESPHALRLAARTGSTLAANCTASGKAMLATLADEDVMALFPGEGRLPSQTESSIVVRSELLAELAKVRERGYALNLEESELGAGSVAVAVHGPHRILVAALAISAPLSRLPDERITEIADHLRGEAERLAVLAGLRPGKLA